MIQIKKKNLSRCYLFTGFSERLKFGRDIFIRSVMLVLLMIVFIYRFLFLPLVSIIGWRQLLAIVYVFCSLADLLHYLRNLEETRTVLDYWWIFHSSKKTDIILSSCSSKTIIFHRIEINHRRTSLYKILYSKFSSSAKQKKIYYWKNFSSKLCSISHSFRSVEAHKTKKSSMPFKCIYFYLLSVHFHTPVLLLMNYSLR